MKPFLLFVIHIAEMIIMRNILVLLLCCVLSYACSDDEVDDELFFRMSRNVVLLDAYEQVYNIEIESNVEWDIENLEVLPDWIGVDKITDRLLNISVKENNSYDVRNYRIVFDEPIDTCFIDVTQEAKAHLTFIGEKNYMLSALEDTLKVEVKNNIPFDIIVLDEGDNWISEMNNIFPSLNIGNELFFQIEENNGNVIREANIVISNEEYHLSDTLSIVQQANDGDSKQYVDGSYYIVNESLKGKVNVVVVGDGFTRGDLNKDGYYENSLNKAIEYFFSIEPYKSYREYFNVYMVIAESKEKGVGEKNLFGGSTINNKFGTAYGNGTEIVCNDELILEYAGKIKELPENKPKTVLVVLNSDKYAGTAYLYRNGNSIALCPMSTAEPPNDFEGIVHHEAGGHAFGFLCDEYVYNQSEMPEERKNSIKDWQKEGFHLNLDFTNDLDKILWKDFIGYEKYSPVGAYEGGYEYQYGVWRSEENSCMNNNIPYYNVQSRWCIVNRIMQLSDIEFSVQDFINNDNPVYPVSGRALNVWEDFRPLGNPVWINR